MVMWNTEHYHCPGIGYLLSVATGDLGSSRHGHTWIASQPPSPDTTRKRKYVCKHALRSLKLFDDSYEKELLSQENMSLFFLVHENNKEKENTVNIKQTFSAPQKSCSVRLLL